MVAACCDEKFIYIFITISLILISLFAGCTTASPLKEEPVAVEEPVAIEDIKPKKKYEFFNIIPIRGLTADDPPKTFHAKIIIGYIQGREKVKTELAKRKEMIENIVFLYLGEKKQASLVPGLYRGFRKN